MPRLAALAALLLIAIAPAAGGSRATENGLAARAGCTGPSKPLPSRPHASCGRRHRRDGLVRVAGPRRPQRRRPAGDRRALLLHVRLRREGAPPRQGHGDERPGVRARRRRRPRRRQRTGDRRRRQRGNRRRVRAPRRSAAAQARLAGVDVQRRPVPRGARDGGRRSRRRRPHRDRRHDDEHLVDRRRRSSCSTRRAPRTGRRVHPPRRGRGTTRCPARATMPTSTASATTATAPTARTSASATSTTTRSSRSSSRSTTTRSTSSTTTGRRCSPRPGTRNRDSRHSGRRLGWGQFIRWLSPRRRGPPLPPACGPVAAPAHRRCGCSGRPRRRRSPTSTATGGTR